MRTGVLGRPLLVGERPVVGLVCRARVLLLGCVLVLLALDLLYLCSILQAFSALSRLLDGHHAALGARKEPRLNASCAAGGGSVDGGRREKEKERLLERGRLQDALDRFRRIQRPHLVNPRARGHSNTSSGDPTVRDKYTACPLVPGSLVGPSRPNTSVPSLEELAQLAAQTGVSPGGRWSPHDCRARQSLAIIVPYRARPSHLLVFLRHIHAFLQRQRAQYTVYIIEQRSPSTFNRGALLNVGFLEAHRRRGHTCFILHDLDLLAQDDHNLYTCGQHPLHLGLYVDTLQYSPRLTIVGGVLAVTATHMLDTNGFSNTFWGWGGEDDDMYRRLTMYRNYVVEIPSWPEGKYTMLEHPSNRNKPDTHHRQRGARFHGTNYPDDGLSSVRYSVTEVREEPLFTRLTVDLLITP